MLSFVTPGYHSDTIIPTQTFVVASVLAVMPIKTLAITKFTWAFTLRTTTKREDGNKGQGPPEKGEKFGTVGPWARCPWVLAQALGRHKKLYYQATRAILNIDRSTKQG